MTIRKVTAVSSADSGLVAHAERELKAAGLLGFDSDYEGMIGASVLDLCTVLSSQGHSGGSAMETLYAFSRVSLYKPLTPITSNPDEWFMPLTGDEGNEDTPLWQSNRQPDLFSYDAGQTWYSVDDPRWQHRWNPFAWLWRRHWLNLQKKAGA